MESTLMTAQSQTRNEASGNHNSEIQTLEPSQAADGIPPTYESGVRPHAESVICYRCRLAGFCGNARFDLRGAADG